MNGYDLVRKMKTVRVKHALSSSAQLLYHELVDVCNNKRWPETFSCSNILLCKSLHISEPTLVKARLSLVEAGLIVFISGKSKRTSGVYSFTTSNKGSTTKECSVSTTKKESDYLKQTSKNIPPLSPQGRKRVRENLTFVDIADKLFMDDTWRQYAAKRLFLETNYITDDYLTRYLEDIVLIGDEHQLKTIREAKRRFYCWWRKHGKYDFF